MKLDKLILSIVSTLVRLIPNNIPGKIRFSKKLLWSVLNKENYKVKDNDNLLYIVPSLREPIAYSLFVNGEYEKDSIDYIKTHLANDDVFIDVGANIGIYSINIAKTLNSGVCVYAIEASPKIYSYLVNNLEINSVNNVKTFQYAITDLDNFTVPFYEAPTESFGMGSLAPQFHTTPIEVTTKKLDSIISKDDINRVSAIKVDVDGYESLVFKGAQDILSFNSPLVVFEFCDWAERRAENLNAGDSQRILRDYGYKIYCLVSSKLIPVKDIYTEGSYTLIGSKYEINSILD